MQQFIKKTIQMKLSIVLIFFVCFSTTFAAVPTEWRPQNGQTTEWSVNSNNELTFTGIPGSAAMIATQFGDAGTPPFTGFTLKFDAYIAGNGASTSLVLGSNAVWGGTGIVLEINKWQLVGVKNFLYPGVQISSNVPVYQSKVIADNFNAFEINVSGTGLITVKINDYACPTNYQADVSILEAVAPASKVALFTTSFSGFKLRNVKIVKNMTERQWFVPVVQLSGAYYIDSQNGSDLNSGQAENVAWRTFANINRTTLAAGTKVLLKKGGTWNQRLEIRGAGTSSNWISVGAYGTNPAKPKISLTNNANDIGLLICDLDKTTGTARQQNISYVEVKDIEIANTRLGIYYRTITGSTNTGFKVNNVSFNNINCDAVMSAINNAADKNAEITAQLSAVKGNLETLTGAADGGVREYIFPAAIFIGGQTATNQRISVPSSQRTVLTEFEVTNCVMNEAIAGVMSWFYWPFATGMGTDAWRQIVHKVKLQNITATGIVNGLIAFDGVNGGCTTNANNEPQPDANGWGLIKNVAVTMGSAVAGRTWPNGTTGAIFNNSQRFLVDSCEFSELLNQGNPDGCGFDFESNNDLLTIQNSKFIRNDGHSILMMNGGSFGGNTNTIIQKNLFAGNVKFGTSTNELYLNATSDNGGTHANLKIRNNIVFMRKKNKNNQNISFYATSGRTYITATANDLYYLEPTASPITISFWGAPYTYNAQMSSVTAPQVSALTLNNGATATANRTIQVKNEYSTAYGTPAYYMVSESAAFTGADWILYRNGFSYTLSAGNGGKIIYFKVNNAAGVSPVFSSAISLNEVTTIFEIPSERTNVRIRYMNSENRFEVELDESIPMPSDFKIKLYTLDGKLLFNQGFFYNKLSVKLPSTSKGIYIIKISDCKSQTVFKLSL